MNESTEEELRHALGNARAQTEALKSLLIKAAERLEDLVATQCSDSAQAKALATAQRLRSVIARVDGSDGSVATLGGASEIKP